MSEFESTIDNDEIIATVERPQFLTVLCVLSWIMGGIALISALAMIGFKKMFIEFFEKASEELEGEELEAMQSLIVNYDYSSYSALLFYILSIFAVILMYRLNKIGFYIYAVTHLLISFSPYLYTPLIIDGSFIFSMMILFGFIGMYGANLKFMK